MADGAGVYDPPMPNYRRWHTGRFVFLTVVTAERQAFLCGDLARRLLREAMAAAHAKWPWRTRGLVLLPNHLHLLWELPADDLDYSKRVGRWKSRFTTAWLSAGASEAEVPTGQRRRRLRGVWQQRFFEHTIRRRFREHKCSPYRLSDAPGLHSREPRQARPGRTASGLAVVNVPPVRSRGRVCPGLVRPN